MKLKDHYSLHVEHLQSLEVDLPYPVSTAPNFPTVQTVQNDIEESLNLLQAFGNYLIERNRRRSLERQIRTAKKAIDSWYKEAEKQRQEKLHTAEVQFQCFIEDVKAKNENTLQAAILQARNQAETMKNQRYDTHSNYLMIKKILEYYKDYLTALDRQLDSLRENAAADVRNLYFQRLEDDYMKKLRIIQKYLAHWR